MSAASFSRVVDVSEHGRRLSLDRGFLLVTDADREIGRVPIDDVGAVLLSAYGTSYTSPLVVALAERGAVIVTCGKNHLPVAWTLPVVGHHAQTRIVASQVAAALPLNKRIWQYLVQAKISAQADALEASDKPRAQLDGLICRVKSGDPANVEAWAAQIYWPLLFGADFRRDRDADGANAVLNYGYTVLRSSVARAIVACGLHPSVSIKHRRDPMALTDDLMEPFRPIVDCRVSALAVDGRAQVTREVREGLVELLGNIEIGVLRFVQSIAAVYVDGVAPKWGRHVADRAVRPADNNGGGTQGGDAVPERPSGSRLREDAVVGVQQEGPGSDGDDDE